MNWPFTYGSRLRPRWSHCCFSHQNANVGPVMEFPVDESPFGVFDLTGGSFEWLDAWYDEPRALRQLAGGSWAQARADSLRVQGGMGMAHDFSNGETGLRLVVRPAEPAR
jgi:hypothetical protein